MRRLTKNSTLFVVATSLVVSVVSVAGCQKAIPAPEARLVERTFASMGTELRLTVWTADERSAAEAFESVFDEFDRLEEAMSTWRDRSDVQRLNAAAGRHPVRIDAETLAVLRIAQQVSAWTNGKFDVTFGVMSGLWKFDYQNRDGTIPDRAEVTRRRSLIDYRDLELDESGRSAFLRRQGMMVSLGGIGKGYAVDRARDMLRDRGFGDFLIQFGGDMYAAGRRGDRPWRLGIQDPRAPQEQIVAAMDVSDNTFSTSGDYERFFIKNGRRYHHIVDPRTGEPADSGCRSVTIVTASATVADALSTGVFILGPDEGMALIGRLPGVEGIIVDANSKVLVSSGLAGRVTMRSPASSVP